ncbi:MAG: alcohol dehydrogenase catalytic domain-containing protein [Chloroflexi bacterium]|nr:alcohol dehydrogenase catalytic domain-containing protein [Chloroflexota bacterium]
MPDSTPQSMKGALHDAGDLMELRDDLPMPEQFPGSALIRVRRTGICGSDLHMNNERTEPQTMPGGHEVAGEVVEVPAGETRIAVGDRVAVETIGSGKACNECWYCNMGQYRHCTDKSDDTGGGFAEYMTRKPGGLYKLPDEMSWTDGALVEPLAVSVHAVRWGGMAPGDTVAVVGSATIGLAAIAAARQLGAGRIIASARYEQQATAAARLGADVVVGSEPGELEEAAREATDGRGADMVFESIGGNTADTLVQAMDTCRMQGKIVVIGGFRKPVEFDFLAPMLNEQSILLSSCYGIVDGHHDYEVSIDILASGRVPFHEIVTHNVPLSDIQTGFETAYDKSTGSIKVHVEI